MSEGKRSIFKKQRHAGHIFTIALMLVTTITSIVVGVADTGWAAVLWYVLALGAAWVMVSTARDLAEVVLAEWGEEFFEDDAEPPVDGAVDPLTLGRTGPSES